MNPRLEREPGLERPPGACVAEAVVAGALLRVGEDLVRLGGLLEALLGGLVARVLVRVELVGELAVGALQLLGSSRVRETPSTS